MMECVYLKNAKYIGGFRIYLWFNDGKAGEVNLKEVVHNHEVAMPLRKSETFARFFLDSWPTLAWDCGFDVAPEKLYEMCEPSAEPDGLSPAG
jgi:hypothetical protein